MTGRGPIQRVDTYIVISKPKRMSVKLGFVHIMTALRAGEHGVSLSQCAAVVLSDLECLLHDLERAAATFQRDYAEHAPAGSRRAERPDRA